MESIDKFINKPTRIRLRKVLVEERSALSPQERLKFDAIKALAPALIEEKARHNHPGPLCTLAKELNHSQDLKERLLALTEDFKAPTKEGAQCIRALRGLLLSS